MQFKKTGVMDLQNGGGWGGGKGVECGLSENLVAVCHQSTQGNIPEDLNLLKRCSTTNAFIAITTRIYSIRLPEKFKDNRTTESFKCNERHKNISRT